MCHRDKFNPLAKRFDMLEFNQTKILSDFLFNQNCFEENQYTRKLFLSNSQVVIVHIYSICAILLVFDKFEAFNLILKFMRIGPIFEKVPDKVKLKLYTNVSWEGGMVVVVRPSHS